ncbi:protein kinase, putative [Trypanosoma brucei gambiense DAL972]|uniref:non-specific serine/threonine protein kinase n=2 Tax=Trypanosoma brucei TaxID=5691 RepID=D0A5M3_TRYB9|nr:protein kinase, putative [Trypanosoma brucei gambiense DAL972]RHW68059.1 protein kinase [Trypanosoma brucei equiperdum]CBH16974.1 protein kinase, putative [Trypanosoma brucei gambiense DAL972]|eukprot:XP_011779238.1 protein kinase, putative [Trypanosoma brucei gambiense DAL972]
MNTHAAAVTVGSVLFQCAESRVYECDFYSHPAVCKYRLPKPYRHPTLDKRLREQRSVREARALVRCQKQGIAVPAVYAIDRESCAIVMERIIGMSVRDVLNEVQRPLEGAVSPVAARVLEGMGEVVGLLHNAHIIHGDLTTSNFMYRTATVAEGKADSAACGAAPRDRLVVLDFGLVMDKNSAEERAVDLYVLERAIKSSHPSLEGVASAFILNGYRRTADPHQVEATITRLGAVRARGRKRSMVG